MVLLTIIQIIGYLASAFTMVVIASFIMSILISFNVISLSSQYVEAIYRSLNMLIDPIVKPIRKILPDTGMIDFSPMVLIIGLHVLQIILSNIAIGLQ